MPSSSHMYQFIYTTIGSLSLSLVIAMPASGGGDESVTPLGDRPAAKTGFIRQLKFDGPPTTCWQFPRDDDHETRRVGLSDVATSGGMIFFGNDLGVVRALTARRGVLIWKHEHGERVYFTPCCDGERLFFTTRKGITALQSSSGIPLWHKPVRHSVGRCVSWQPSEMVFFSDSDGWLYALDSATGEQQWQATFLDDAPADPPGFPGERARFQGMAARPTGIATDGQRVFQSVFDQCRVVAYDCRTGERMACYQTEGWILGDPAINGDRLYVGSQDKHLYCFDTATDQLLWKRGTGARIESGVGIVKDRVIVGSCDGSVYCWDKQTGRLLWKRETDDPGAIYSDPIVTRESVYLAAAEGTVYALDVESGAVRWRHRPAPLSRLYTSPATDGTRLFVKCRPRHEGTGQYAIFAIGPRMP